MRPPLMRLLQTSILAWVTAWAWLFRGAHRSGRIVVGVALKGATLPLRGRGHGHIGRRGSGCGRWRRRRKRKALVTRYVHVHINITSVAHVTKAIDLRWGARRGCRRGWCLDGRHTGRRRIVEHAAAVATAAASDTASATAAARIACTRRDRHVCERRFVPLRFRLRVSLGCVRLGLQRATHLPSSLPSSFTRPAAATTTACLPASLPLHLCLLLLLRE